jgi:hypothetical protein
MQVKDVKRHAFRTLLVLHFIALALTLGVRLASFVIYRVTSHADLQALSFGRDLTGVLARSLTLPGFLLTVVTGVLMVLLRYGLRPPIWVWMKVGLTTAALSLATPVVAPALEAAREWARWSAEHGQLAIEFRDSAAKASLYGGIVFALFLLNIPIAVWKPFSGLKVSQLLSRRISRTESRKEEVGSDQNVTHDGSYRGADRGETVAPRAARRRS